MPNYVEGTATVRVPATSANLGPGFDSLGLALDFHDVLTARVIDGPLSIEVTGTGADSVPRDATHLVHRAMAAAFEALDFEGLGTETPGIELTCANRIPHARGMGSSSAAIIAGIVLARALVSGGTDSFDDMAVLALANRLEGHPDNVAPALLGGLTIAVAEDEVVRVARLEVDPTVRAVLFVPDNPVETEFARELLPDVVPHGDAAANAGRAALLVAALTGQPDLLLAATRDLLHQEYRAPAMPESLDLVHRLRADGVAAVISGAGPTVLCLVPGEGADALAGLAPAGWQVHLLHPGAPGAEVSVSG